MKKVRSIFFNFDHQIQRTIQLMLLLKPTDLLLKSGLPV